MDINKLLIKNYRHDIFSPFLKAIKEYSLIEENDRIAVAISGGKDSLTLAICFSEILKYTEIPFSVKYILMDPGYSEENLKKIRHNFNLLNLDVEIFNTNIFKISTSQDKNKCYICAKMRRGALYNKAKELGCNKLALGHHNDDVIETLLMSILYQGEVGGMKPILDSTNYIGMKLIRPLYLVSEESIIKFINETDLEPIKAGCFMTDGSIPCMESKRAYIKNLIKNLEEDNNSIKKNLFNSMSNINLGKLNYKEESNK